MGLSSKVAACLCWSLLLIDQGGAAVAVRAGAGMAPAARPTRAPLVVRGGDAGRRPAGRRLRRGYGDAGLGLAGLGLGVAGYGLDAGDGLDVGGGPPPPLGPFGPMLPPPVVLPLPPACPLIIKVGRGLTHAVKTQVLYGRPVCRP